jgi:hypothetical protein
MSPHCVLLPAKSTVRGRKHNIKIVTRLPAMINPPKPEINVHAVCVTIDEVRIGE